MKTSLKVTIALLGCGLTLALARAADLDPAQQAKVDAKLADIKAWAADPAITQDKWKALSLLDPFVRSFSKNDAGVALKGKKTDAVTEAFVSDAKGYKVAFLAKTTNWCHAGSPKHDVPMTGKTWQGAPALDESTGLQQLQISVPVLKDGKPIGSLVVGLSPTKL